MTGWARRALTVVNISRPRGSAAWAGTARLASPRVAFRNVSITARRITRRAHAALLDAAAHQRRIGVQRLKILADRDRVIDAVPMSSSRTGTVQSGLIARNAKC
jgi:hypothetical protein